LIGMCLIGAAIFLIFKLRKRFPTVAFGLAWILITFSINLAPRANVIFEHKLYLISFGFFLALVSALFIIIRPRKLLIGILITMATLLSVSGFFRNQIWKNELTLWDDVIQKSPHKARPYRNRGLAYANQGNFSQAIADYTQAIAIDPKYADAYYNRGIAYDRQGNFSQAICDYTKAINIIPNSADAYNNRGIVYGEQNNVSGAISDYNKAIELNPAYAQAYVNRANIYDDQKNSAQAISDYNKAIASDPDFAEAYYDRAVSYYQLKNYGQAWSDVRKAEKLGYAVNPELINALKQVSADPDG